MEVDIVCVGFGPAVAGFLTALAPALVDAGGTPVFESAVLPGAPPQVACFERAGGLGFGVSGVATRAQAIEAAIPGFASAGVPMVAPVAHEAIAYLLDPIGASRRSTGVRVLDRLVRFVRPALRGRDSAVELPFIPSFLRKDGGVVMSIGQFTQWVSERVMASGAVQVWPGTPVAAPIVEGDRVAGVRLVDQGTDRAGKPAAGFTPGMEVRAALTVVGDGPAGAVGRQIDEAFGLPPRCRRSQWALGMKMVVDLRPGSTLEPGTVLHTIGYPEPEIFGFMYVHPDRVASLGIFVPSWFDSPVRTAYRYLQHWVQHPYLWRHLEGAVLRSWGARSIQESGRLGEPLLAGNGYARIGEGSGTTNILSGSGVDEAWATGVQLAGAVVSLLEERKPFTKENLERTYVAARRESWVETEARASEHARDGFDRGVVRGLAGMALAGLSAGRLSLRATARPSGPRPQSLEAHYRGRIGARDLEKIVADCRARGVPLHDALMDRAGWPPVPFDGRLLVSHQDAMLVGGKVQAPPGFADHVVFVSPERCRACEARVCIEACSGQAILPGGDGVPTFDRDRCVHCGACLWNCSQVLHEATGRGNIEFLAGAGGLHSGEN